MNEFAVKTDILVVGAGAAGLMTAISAARHTSKTVHLLDTRFKIGSKILISGGTRCNVTNRRVTPQDYCGSTTHFIRHALEAYTPEKTRQFFEQIGVPLSLEPSGKYFPVSHSGKTVLEALVAECHARGVNLVRGLRMISAKRCAEGFEVECVAEEGRGVQQRWFARRLALCTGGLSLPETGSDGMGYVIAKSLGHHVVPTAAALTPFLGRDESWNALAGVTLESVTLDLYVHAKKKKSVTGGFLFTHFGFSGPAALDLSRHWSTEISHKKDVHANFLPGVKEEAFKLALTRVSSTTHAVEDLLSKDFRLPRRLAKRLADLPNRAGKLTQGWQLILMRNVFHCPLSVKDVYGYKKAEVTAGGVDLKEVTVSTMESKKTPHLYFAGEILDVDGRIGGFNFQWAWSTGYVAGKAMAASLA